MCGPGAGLNTAVRVESMARHVPSQARNVTHTFSLHLYQCNSHSIGYIAIRYSTVLYIFKMLFKCKV